MKKITLFAIVFMLAACPFTTPEEDMQKAVEETIAAIPKDIPAATETSQEPPISPTPTFTSLPPAITPTPVPQPSDSELGQIKGILVDENTGQPVPDRPQLWRDVLENETDAELHEIQELFNKIELEIDEQGGFLFKGVPYGQYLIFTKKHGMVTDPFMVEQGQLVDLGEIKIP
jgi:hypothetical protein